MKSSHIFMIIVGIFFIEIFVLVEEERGELQVNKTVTNKRKF